MTFEIDYTLIIVIGLTAFLPALFLSYKHKPIPLTWGIMCVILPLTWDIYYRMMVLLLFVILAAVISEAGK